MDVYDTEDGSDMLPHFSRKRGKIGIHDNPVIHSRFTSVKMQAAPVSDACTLNAWF